MGCRLKWNVARDLRPTDQLRCGRNGQPGQSRDGRTVSAASSTAQARSQGRRQQTPAPLNTLSYERRRKCHGFSVVRVHVRRTTPVGVGFEGTQALGGDEMQRETKGGRQRRKTCPSRSVFPSAQQR